MIIARQILMAAHSQLIIVCKCSAVRIHGQKLRLFLLYFYPMSPIKSKNWKSSLLNVCYWKLIRKKKTVKINVEMSNFFKKTCRKLRISMVAERCKKFPGRLKLEGVRGIVWDWRQEYAAIKGLRNVAVAVAVAATSPQSSLPLPIPAGDGAAKTMTVCYSQ